MRPGSVCRHLKIAGRVPIWRFFHVTSQQPRKVATHPSPRSPSCPQTKTHDQLERFHPSSYGCSGGNGFLHGGSAYAPRLGYLLRVVLYPVGESESLSGRNHARMVKIFDRFEKARLAASTSLLGLPSSPPR